MQQQHSVWIRTPSQLHNTNATHYMTKKSNTTAIHGQENKKQQYTTRCLTPSSSNSSSNTREHPRAGVRPGGERAFWLVSREQDSVAGISQVYRTIVRCSRYSGHHHPLAWGLRPLHYSDLISIFCTSTDRKSRARRFFLDFYRVLRK